MDEKALVENIDKSVSRHISSAQSLISIIYWVAFFVFVLFAAYVLPGIANRELHVLRESAQEADSEYNKAASEFSKKYGKNYRESKIKRLEDCKEMSEARSALCDSEFHDAGSVETLAQYSSGKNILLWVATIISHLTIDDNRVEFILKTIPYALGATLAGLMFAYRLHIISARELESKKMDFMMEVLRTNSEKKGSPPSAEA